MWEEKRGKNVKCKIVFGLQRHRGFFFFFSICHLQMYLDKKQNVSIFNLDTKYYIKWLTHYSN